jgi:YtcA family
MIGNRRSRLVRCGLLLALLPLANCSRAPSFEVLGSFFPAWLVCFAVAIPLTVFVRSLLLRLQVAVVFPVLIYPSLAALFTLALWLAFFH